LVFVSVWFIIVSIKETAMDINAITGVRVKELRNELGIKAEALASDLHITKGYLSKIENGKVNITLVQLQAFADVLKVPVSALFPSAASPIQINKENYDGSIQNIGTFINNSDKSVKDMFQMILEKLK
jgi:transcriptional regulator with XRE-family HTH domain